MAAKPGKGRGRQRGRQRLHVYLGKRQPVQSWHGQERLGPHEGKSKGDGLTIRRSKQ
jgi:hypothetical protein